MEAQTFQCLFSHHFPNMGRFGNRRYLCSNDAAIISKRCANFAATVRYGGTERYVQTGTAFKDVLQVRGSPMSFREGVTL